MRMRCAFLVVEGKKGETSWTVPNFRTSDSDIGARVLDCWPQYPGSMDDISHSFHQAYPRPCPVFFFPREPVARWLVGPFRSSVGLSRRRRYDTTLRVYVCVCVCTCVHAFVRSLPR